jgi:hypothetical protein
VFSFEKESQPAISGVRRECTNIIATEETLYECLKFTEQKKQYYNGNRNNFICLFANNANRWGISEAETLAFCISNFDLEEKEIKSTVYSVYKNNIADFASFAESTERLVGITDLVGLVCPDSLATGGTARSLCFCVGARHLFSTHRAVRDGDFCPHWVQCGWVVARVSVVRRWQDRSPYGRSRD